MYDHLPVKPMLCERYPSAFNQPGWIWEPKLDGIRIMAEVEGDNQRLWARSGTEKTLLFPEIKIKSSVSHCIFDGEVISGESFQNIQHRANRLNGIEQSSKDFPASYVVFDILMSNGISLLDSSLAIRKAILRDSLIESENVKLNDYCWEDGITLFQKMRENALEGVVGKQLAGFYLPGKRKWIKVKCWNEDIFQVVGYTQGTGRRLPTFGALVLANLEGKYVGEVGTGFTDDETIKVFNFMQGRLLVNLGEAYTSVGPFKVKIKYLEYTNDSILRLPVYKGRID